MTVLKRFADHPLKGAVVLVAAILVAAIAFSVIVVNSAFGAETVSLVEVGSSYTTEGGGKTMPLFAVMIGNTGRAERLANIWSKFFGPYSLNATLWVHPADEPADVWKRVIYHRPRNIYEAQVFYENHEVWKFEQTDKAHMILPGFVRALPPAELAKVEFVITYFSDEGGSASGGDGGTKVYIKSWTPPADAKALFEAIEQTHRE